MLLMVAMGIMLFSPIYEMRSSSSSTAVTQNLYSHDMLKEGRDETELHSAVRAGSMEQVHLLCRRKKLVNKLNDNGSTATLKSSSNEGSIFKRVPGFAPIHLAVMSKNPAIVEILLSAGGEPNCYGGLPNLKAVVTPLYFMLDERFFDIHVLQILLNRGASFFHPYLSGRSCGITTNYSVLDILFMSHEMKIEKKDLKNREQVSKKSTNPLSEEDAKLLAKVAHDVGVDITQDDMVNDLFYMFPLVGPLTQNPLSRKNVQILCEVAIDTAKELIPVYDLFKRAPDYAMKGIAKKSFRLFAPSKKFLKVAYQQVSSFLKDRMKNSLFKNAELQVHIEALTSANSLSINFARIILDFLTSMHGDPKDIFGPIDQKVILTLLTSASSQEVVTSFVLKKFKSIFEEFIAQHEKNEKRKQSLWRTANRKKILTEEQIARFDPATVYERYGHLIREGIAQRCSELNRSFTGSTSTVATDDNDLDDALSSDDEK